MDTEAVTVIDYQGVDVMRSEHVVLRGVSLTIKAGELVYLIGKVGSGKSSLLKTLYGEVAVQGDGSAKVLDFDMYKLKRRQRPMLRRSIGVVFQDFRLLTDRNVYANLEFVLRATGVRNKVDIDDAIERVLQRVGMTNKGYKMPHELSGGEQQRIAIARALLNNPGLIIADEPTGNLDPETGDQIIRHLKDISALGTAVLIATHNHSVIDTFPGRVLRCEGKNLIEDQL